MEVELGWSLSGSMGNQTRLKGGAVYWEWLHFPRGAADL
jgi:hypothetical protein